MCIRDRYNIDLHGLYVDYKHTCDSLKRKEILNLNYLHILGMPSIYFNLIYDATLVGSKAAIRVDGELTATFDINAWIQQGDALFTTFFNLVLEAAIQKLGTTGYIGVKTTQVCTYADNVAIINRNKRGLKEISAKLVSEVQMKGLKIYEGKTKYMELRRTMTNVSAKSWKFYI